jgi:molybdopterin synthase sulfur carrier subunit
LLFETPHRESLRRFESNSLIQPVFLFVEREENLQVSVRFFTVLREVTGKKEEILQFSEGTKVTVDTVLKSLAKSYGKRFTEYVYEPRTGEVKGFLQFFINGKSASTLNGLETVLEDGDVLAIVPPVSGG